MGLGPQWAPPPPRTPWDSMPSPGASRSASHALKYPWWAYAGVGFFALFSTGGVVWISMSYSVRAGSECHIYDAPERFAMLGSTIVAMIVLAAISTAASVVATRVHPIVGLVVALTFALILGYLILAETGPAIREYYAGSAPWPTCPDGLPDWWPSWAPR